MSAIAVKKINKKEFEISADSIRMSGWTQEKDKKAKLWRIGDLILGTSGLCSIGSLFREFIENHKPKTNNEYGWINLVIEFIKYHKSIDDKTNFNENDFIVIWQNRSFYIGGLFVREIEDYYAIGAGMDFALSALYLGHNTKKACEVATEFSTFCEKPIITLKN